MPEKQQVRGVVLRELVKVRAARQSGANRLDGDQRPAVCEGLVGRVCASQSEGDRPAEHGHRGDGQHESSTNTEQDLHRGAW